MTVEVLEYEKRSVTRTGPSISDRIHFVVATKKFPSAREISMIQGNIGYAPQGYDGPWNIHTTKEGPNCFVTKWNCSASCD